MVKLFVGNLSETVDSAQLKQAFKQFTTITDCDIVKNYAFITIPDEDKNIVMQRMSGYIMDGRQLQIKLSTSKLRSQSQVPSGCCLRCTSADHKTPNCPDDPKNQGKEPTLIFDLTGSLKRGANTSMTALGAPDAKRVNYDEEIPQPPEPDLQQLFEEYRLSRQRYSYYKDRLIKEIEAKRGPGTAYLVYPTTAPAMAGTQLSSAPITYSADAYSPPAIAPAAPYNTALKAPYQAATNLTPNAPYAQASNPNSMTSEQFLQQLQGAVGATLSAPYQSSSTLTASPTVGQPPAAPTYASYGSSSGTPAWMQSLS